METTNVSSKPIDLLHLSNEFLKANYGLTLDVPLKRNNRLTVTRGQFIHINKVPECVELSGRLLDYGGEKEVLDTLKHELIHYALCKLGKPHEDGTQEFETNLRKHGVTSTGTSNYVGPVVRYSCFNCSKKAYAYVLKILKKHESYKTICCKAELTNVRKDVMYGDGFNHANPPVFLL